MLLVPLFRHRRRHRHRLIGHIYRRRQRLNSCRCRVAVAHTATTTIIVVVVGVVRAEHTAARVRRLMYVAQEYAVEDDQHGQRYELDRDGYDPEVDQLVELKVRIQFGFGQRRLRSVRCRIELVDDLVLEKCWKCKKKAGHDGQDDDFARSRRPTPVARVKRVDDGDVALDGEHDYKVDAGVAREVANGIEDEKQIRI